MNIKRKISISILLCIFIIIQVICMAMLTYDGTHDIGLFRLINENRYIEMVTIRSTVCIALTLVFFISMCWWALISDKLLIVVGIRNRRIDLNKIIYSVFMLLIVFVLAQGFELAFLVKTKYVSEKSIYDTRQVLSTQKAVVHALGAIDRDGNRYSYTNSLEALDNCYLHNNKVAELDLMVTSDGDWVGAHDGDDTWAYGYPFTEVPTKEEFMKERFLGVLSPLDIGTVAEFMRDKGDFYVVTDIKDNNYEGCKYISENYPDLMDHFIIQIYHISEYDEIHDLGFNNIIYTLYQATEEEWNAFYLIENTKKYDLVGITFWESWMGLDFFFDRLINGVETPLFVHTVNDKESIENDLKSNVLIYTDNTENDWMR